MKNFLRRIKDFYLNLRLQTKFTITHLVIAAIPLILMIIFFYGKLYDMIVADTIRHQQDASAQTGPQLEELMDRITKACQTVQNTETYRHMLKQNSADDMDQYLSFGQGNLLLETAGTVLQDNPINAIQIYMDIPENHPLFSDSRTSSYFRPLSSVKGTYWYGIFQGTHCQTLYCPPFYLNTYEKGNLGNQAYIIKSSLTYKNEIIPVYTAVYYTDEVFLSILQENLTSENSVAYIVNDRDSTVASTNNALSGTYHFSYSTVEDSFLSSNNFIEKIVLKETVYAGFYRIGEPKWFLVVAIPSRPLIKKSAVMILQLTMIYLAFVLLAFLIAIDMSRSITNRISSVINQMRTVRQGVPTPMNSSEYHDEVGDLIDTYNYMTRKMQALMGEQAQSAENLRIAEFNALQAQINPHFLYNTMDMINWLSQQGKTAEVTDAIQNLSRFYKLTLSRKGTMSTIEQELEHVSIYVHLQNMRFHNTIDLVIDIPDDLLACQIPRLTFQPVVENSILHGIMEKECKSGSIVITGWMDQQDLILLISDDGIGMPKDKVSSILLGKGESKTGSNIAVCNTHQRLQLLYGSGYGLSYSSIQGKGTDVQIRLPLQQKFSRIAVHQDFPLAQEKNNLVTVSDRKAGSTRSPVLPESLLQYSKSLDSDNYRIRELHQISSSLPDAENVYILSHELTGDFPFHNHTYFEINYLCRGFFINEVDDHKIYMSPGDLVILNPQAVHKLCRQSSDAQIINFCLKPLFFQQTLRAFCQEDNPISSFFRNEKEGSANYLFFSLNYNRKAQNLLSELIHTYTDADFHQNYVLDALFLQLFAQLQADGILSYEGTDEKTMEILHYMKIHALSKTLDEIAHDFHQTESSLNDYVKRHTGRSCLEILKDIRLDYAIDQLSNKNISIYQIASACGFHKPEEFSQLFKKRFGISPEDYRRQIL